MRLILVCLIAGGIGVTAVRAAIASIFTGTTIPVVVAQASRARPSAIHACFSLILNAVRTGRNGADLAALRTIAGTSLDNARFTTGNGVLIGQGIAGTAAIVETTLVIPCPCGRIMGALDGAFGIVLPAESKRIAGGFPVPVKGAHNRAFHPKQRRQNDDDQKRVFNDGAAIFIFNCPASCSH